MDSRVEKLFLEQSGQKLIYRPEEKIGVLVVNSFPALGTLTALRFLEWVQENPEGVVSLPTGKTPEYFIKEVDRFLNSWGKKEVRRELKEGGVDPDKRCNLRGLHFVQIDEFYPINPLHHNSFYYYVNKFYLRGFGLDPQKALLINCGEIGLPEGETQEDVWPEGEVDLGLRYRTGSTQLEKMQKRVIENIDQWCSEYERRIRELGGIGFFLGGIGPDGHIGFNIRGSDLYSTTRLTSVNYETQAAAAADLGGIEVAKKRLVITIGLSTITYNPHCLAIIIAAGEARAGITARSIRSERHVLYPASALRKLSDSRFYLTRGAARLLNSRQYTILSRAETISREQIEKAVIDLALQKRKKITALRAEDFRSSSITELVLQNSRETAETISGKVSESLKEKI